MLKLLVKKQMTEIFRSYFFNAKKNRARSKAGIIGYMVLFVALVGGLLGGMFTFLSLALCEPLSAANMDWLYFTLMGFIAVLIGTFGSVFNTFSCLYLAKDNDLLLSMPIPVNTLIASRLLTVYLMGLIYSITVILPAVIVYWITVSAILPVILGGLLLTLLISIFVLTLSCVLGWMVAKISLKLKNKSLITVVVSLAFIGGYYFFYFKAQMLLQNLIANVSVYGEKIKGTAYPLYLFGRIGTGDVFAMLIVSAVILGLFALVWMLISRSFLNTATASGKTAKKVYKEIAVKPKSISGALLSKEFARFLSSPNYMLNCGLGTLLLPIAGVLLLWKGSAVIDVMNGLFADKAACVPLLLCAMVCMVSSMNDMAAPSISLEGKSLWLIQSLPIKPWQVLCAKLKVQLLLTGLPALFCLICFRIVYPYSALEFALTAFVVFTFILLSALFGLFLGLKTANINWTSELVPIKQSFGVLAAMFGSFAFTVLFCVWFMLLDGWKLGFAGYMTLISTVMLALSAVLWCWLRSRGCRLFAAL